MIADFLFFWGLKTPDAAQELAAERAYAQRQLQRARRELQYQKQVLLGAQHQLAYAQAKLSAAHAHCKEVGL